ncbi:MAG: cytochrome P450 [Polyangiaceae bacterium]
MKPPGSPAPAAWQTYRFIAHPTEYMRAIRARYGDIVSFRSLLGEGIAVFEAGLAREVFSAPPETFEAIPLTEALFGGAAVIAVSGERHKKLRKLLNPPFHGAQVRAFLGAMQSAIRGNLRALSAASTSGAALRMTDVSQAMALDVILETVFGSADLDRDEARKVLVDVIRGFAPSIVGGATLHKPWFPPWRRYVKARGAFDAWLTRVVRARRAHAEGNGGYGADVLGVLLAARYEDGEPMADFEVRDQLFTLLLAGHETSAIAMAWCVHHLLRNPGVLAILRAEIDALGPDPAPEAVAKLKYLDAVVCETLRIEPIVTDVVRVCREPLTLGGRWTVPEGRVIAVMLGSILRDARTFPEPERFRPERFLEQRFAASEFVPFGGGARRCLGASFAQNELALAVAEIVSRWELAPAAVGPERSVRRNLTMGPRHGVPIRILGPRSPCKAAAAAPVAAPP